MLNRKFFVPVIAALALGLSACSPGPTPAPTETAATEGTTTEGEAPENTLVRVVSHDSFDLPEALLAKFTADTGYELEFSAPGDAGALVNQLILTKDSPLGDVVYGIDNAFAARAVDAGIVEREQRGRWAFYRLVDETLTALSRSLRP